MKNTMSMESICRVLIKLKPFAAVIFLQFGLAGMDVFSKVALNQGMSSYVFLVYRHAIAAIVIAPFALVLDKKIRPTMTIAIFTKIVLLSLLEPVIDQNLYYLGLKYTTATFAAAMCNILPAITFIMACIMRLEKIKVKSVRTQAKIIGTVATVGGAMLMTLLKGPAIDLFGTTKGSSHHVVVKGGPQFGDILKGSLMITAGCFSWACFMILQAITLKSYPAELSLTALICFFGTVGDAVVALAMERGNNSAWSIQWDEKFMAAVYSGIFCSGLAYYIQGIVMKDRGPVFVAAFNPLSMVIVAVMGSIILGEQMFMGRLLGAVVIVAGLYLVVWGKSKDYASESPSLPEDEKIGVKQTQMSDRKSTNQEVSDINSVDGVQVQNHTNEEGDQLPV